MELVISMLDFNSLLFNKLESRHDSALAFVQFYSTLPPSLLSILNIRISLIARKRVLTVLDSVSLTHYPFGFLWVGQSAQLFAKTFLFFQATTLEMVSRTVRMVSTYDKIDFLEDHMYFLGPFEGHIRLWWLDSHLSK